jgi:hypothetical protein
MRNTLTKTILAATFGLALAFTLGCGEHGWQEIFGDQSSSGGSEQAENSSSSFKANSSGQQQNGDEDEFGVEPPSDDTPTPTSIINSQGTVIVGPLLKTQWGKSDPPDPFHTLPDGTTGWIGCPNVAVAQLLKFHNYPPRGIAGGAFQNIEFDWNNMIDTYRRNANVTEQQKKAITTLVHSLYLYGTGLGGSGGPFTKNFGYDKSIQAHHIKYYKNDSAIKAMVKGQLDSGLPVYVGGNNSKDGKTHTTGHVFVIDGYDSRGKFHVNWGWGGIADGYYPLDSLTPNGRSLDDGFHNYYRVIINIKPDAGGIGSNEMALDNFTVSKAAVPQYEMFNINAQIYSFGIFPGGQVGTALVDNKGNIVKVIGIRDYRSNYNMDAYIPEDVNPGQYTLKIVTRLEGGEWKIVTLSDRVAGIPAAINFTVKPPPPGAPGGGYGLSLTNFTSNKTSVSQNELFTISSTFKNIGSDAFAGGQVGTALVDNSENIAAVVGINNFNSLNAGSSRASTLNSFVPESVKAGQYKLRIVVKPTDGEWRVATLAPDTIPTAINLTIKLPPPGTPGGGYGLSLTNFTSSKTSVSQNELFTVASTFKNVGSDAFPGGQVGAALMDNSGNIAAVVGINNFNSLNAGSSRSSTLNSFVPESVKAGQYKLRIVVRPTNGEWRVATLAPDTISTAINFTVKAETGAPGGGYGLALSEFSTEKNAVQKNEQFTINVNLRNVSSEQFPGESQYGAALIDGSGNIVEIIGSKRMVGAINAGSGWSNPSTATCKVPDTVPFGKYSLRIVIKPNGKDEWRVATMSLPNVPNSIDFTVFSPDKK